MDGICCGYYDEEMEQEGIPLQPDVNEAVSFFKKFIWENEKTESAMKILMFQVSSADASCLHISSLEKGAWCVSASVSNRRRFLGPFFKKVTSKLFIDVDEFEVERLIRKLFMSTLSEFTTLLKSSE